MENRSQTSLEYLLTYGWALILVASIVSVLVFVVSEPASKFSCTSSDPTKFILKGYDLPYSSIFVTTVCSDGSCELWGWNGVGDPPGKMFLQNASGGKILITDVEYGFDSFTQGSCTYNKFFVPSSLNGWAYATISSSSPLPVSAGSQVEISSLYLYLTGSSVCKISDFSFPPGHSFKLTYNDQFGLERELDVICSNFPPKT